jgi:hypothetical protein
LWYQALPVNWSWSSLWYDYTLCSCGAIRTMEGKCPACKESMPEPNWTKVSARDGIEHRIRSHTFMGAEGRYEDHVYLKMLEREWLRPITDEDKFLDVAEQHRSSQRAIVVLVFWTYFETRLERLLRAGMKSLPKTVTEDLLKRYSSVGARVDRLYRILFSTTYWADLTALGYPHVADLLKRVQVRRNQFAHGQPEAIDDSLVEDVVAKLKDEHESWIAAFNSCIFKAHARQR